MYGKETKSVWDTPEVDKSAQGAPSTELDWNHKQVPPAPQHEEVMKVPSNILDAILKGKNAMMKDIKH